MKKIAIPFFVFILCFALAFACLAAGGDHGEIIYETFVNDDETVSLTFYEDGTAVLEGNGYADFDFLWWNSEIKTFIIGEGITDIINMQNLDILKYAVDENNPYFSSDSDGTLYNKDKTELICVPGEYDSVYTVPSTVKVLKTLCFNNCYFSELIIPGTVETIEKYAFFNCTTSYIEIPDTMKVIPEYAFAGLECEAVVLPPSVEKVEENAFSGYFSNYWWDYDGYIKILFVMNPDCVIEEISKNIKIISYSNCAVEDFAKENGNPFDSLDRNHNHIFLCRITKEATCTEDGIYTYNCPCGNATPYTEAIEAYGHYMDYAEDGNAYCIWCGLKPDCDCICHKANAENASPMNVFVYKLYSFFWRLFKINKQCRCGYIYHY